MSHDWFRLELCGHQESNKNHFSEGQKLWVGGGGRGRNNYQGLHAMEAYSKYLMSVFLICKPDFSELGKLLQKKPDNTVIAQNHRQT